MGSSFVRIARYLVALAALHVAMLSPGHAQAAAPEVGDPITNPINGASEVITALRLDSGQVVTDQGNVVHLYRDVGDTFNDGNGATFTVLAVTERTFGGETVTTQLTISDGTQSQVVETVAFDPTPGGLFINPFSADIEGVQDVNNGTLLTEDGDILRFTTTQGAIFQIGAQSYEVIGRTVDALGRITEITLSDGDPVAPEIRTLDRLQAQPVIGGMIENPTTGVAEEIIEIEANGLVETALGNVFLFNTDIGDAYIADIALLFITDQVFDGEGVFSSVDLTDYADDPFNVQQDIAIYNPDDGSGDTDGLNARDETITPPAGNANTVAISRHGGNGNDGRDGYGLEVSYTETYCSDYVTVLGIRICSELSSRERTVIIGQEAHAGQNGKIPAPIGVTVTVDASAISNDLPGVSVTSIGGNGGEGGDAFGALDAREGGEGGDGGDITVTNQADINTSGDRGHGIYALSGAGEAGEGGSGFIASGSGSGGDGGTGGTVTVVNDTDGRIFTSGDRSHGVTAKSTGGSGSSSGDSYGIVGIANSGGSAGGNGGTVIIENRGYVETSGFASNGLRGQSLGGDGGDEGNSGGIISVGNASGDAEGGDGGDVQITNSATGTVRTTGAYSHGIYGQSVGGGGGDGGVSAGLVAVGSQGSAGGDGGDVSIANVAGGAVVTTGAGSYAIKAQSIGGGGGSGGTTGAGLVAVGSSGGSGSDGGGVTVNNAGTLRTEHSQSTIRQTYNVFENSLIAIDPNVTFDVPAPPSIGILAQSIGGGGGSAEGAGAAAVTVGGRGSAGGDGHAVTVTNSGSVETASGGGTGIKAQSIGGGGGSGALSIGLVSVGGGGGAAGDGGTVRVTNSGTVLTANNLARGIIAQSIGGGGGSGGIAAGAVSIGGGGSASGNGGGVTVLNSGQVETEGAHASAIFAQSIGGGGGSGGTSGGLITVGGSSSGGGDAGNVTIQNTGQILTHDYASSGITAQSIGGGGGDGGHAYAGAPFASVAVGASGASGGEAGRVHVALGDTAEAGARIETLGASSHGIYAQAIGGGGGNGGDSVSAAVGAFGSVSVAIGGSGGSGSEGGRVEVTGAGDIITRGQDSTGITATSIGGGGGTGGASFAFGLAAGPVSGALTTSVGGRGGSGGDGDQIDINTGGTILTEGRNARAIHAQSIGGGGGTGNIAVGGAASLSLEGSLSAGASVGGSGGSGGDADSVALTYDGAIETTGEESDAVVLQSIGGGGGIGGLTIDSRLSISGGISLSGASAVGGSGGGGGDGGHVAATLGGSVATRGDGSVAVIAESIGGGGGEGGFSVSSAVSAAAGAGSSAVGIGGTGGDGGVGADVRFTGNNLAVQTDGADATGVTAASIGGGGGRGAFNITNSLSISAAAGGSVRSGVGGAGGGGGGGGDVTVDYTGSINVDEDALALDVTSIGGGGGRGAYSISSGMSIAATGSGTVGFGLGGSGGAGGRGGNITANFAGAQNGATSIQSIGGGGGNGAFNISSGLSASTHSGNINIGIGGFGGSGGASGDVVTNHTGPLRAFGPRVAYAARSVAGGGGTGAFNITGGLNLATGAGGQIGFGLGGFGGSGGAAGSVAVYSLGVIDTTNEAFLSQSIGGGGGDGAFNIAGGLNASGGGISGNATIGIGGSGGTGGDGGAVTALRNGATRYAEGDGTVVSAQSIGGGGGNGAFNITGGANFTTYFGANATFGLGGSGGVGGSGGAVDFRALGNVTRGFGDISDTYGLADFLASHADRFASERTDAITAQSIGGGGGTGAFNITGGISAGSDTKNSPNIALGIGGAGGTGGAASNVDLFVAAESAGCTQDACDLSDPMRALITASGKSATGVTAQSIGGGGGTGGFNISGGISTGSAITLGIGGAGGTGGRGDDVDANVFADIYALGDHATGILAESIGGGGGNGGFNVAGSVSAESWGGASLNLGIGGDAGSGNEAGRVDLRQLGNVTALGDGAHGVVAQSIGGSGGMGGFNASGSLGLIGLSPSFAVGVGGSGGSGALARDVLVESGGDIMVAETDEIADLSGGTVDPGASDAISEVGLLAQSIGGGGGNGGFNLNFAVSTLAPVLGANVTVGGSGGDAGHAGDVTVRRGHEVAGTVLTFGDDATGLLAQSVGGGGGNAALNLGLSLSAAPINTPALAAKIGVGGGGGSPGNAGAVDVDHIGSIHTHGLGSRGLFAQSVGGGGGNAAININAGVNVGAKSANVAVGGSPGIGGQGGDVAVNHNGTIATEGADSSAIFAQSIGGGGGNAALNMALNLGGAADVNVGIGRMGGSGGAAGAVAVVSDGILQTEGHRASAIFAQSVGNGGGTSGSISTGATVANTASASASVGLEGGIGGTADTVDVEARGVVTTSGDESHGIHAQSIGGGGGVGGMALTLSLQKPASAGVSVGGTGGTGGVAGDVTVETHAQISTSGADANGVFAQSVGGAGGVGGVAASFNFGALGAEKSGSVGVNIGGNGGAGAEARAVSVLNYGTISTQTDRSHGVVAQSVGGGGGSGGATVNFDLTVSKGSTGNFNLSIGGTGGEGGTGGGVTVDNYNTITTTGDEAFGVFAQSVGGGGGDGGLVAEMANRVAQNNTSLAINLGGDGGFGGEGGAVDVTNQSGAFVHTTGEGAHGIFAQSIGGGGGMGGAVLSERFNGANGGAIALGFNFGGAGGAGNIGGDVTVTNDGVIRTEGGAANGIFAQSVGGGGGTGGFVAALQGSNNILSPKNTGFVFGGSGGDGGDGGTVTVTNTGRITTFGRRAHAIKAQSVGGGGGDSNLGFGVSSLGSTLLANAFSLQAGTINGGTGGRGGDVTVNHTGTIEVFGDEAEAVVAESINGGGGGLVLDFNSITSMASLTSLQFPTADGTGSLADYGETSEDSRVEILSGSEEAEGFEAGEVTLNLTGNVVTIGSRSTGLRNQSIGGGGGNQNISMTLAQTDGITANPLAFSASLGSRSSNDNIGRNVAFTHTGTLIAQGEDATGAFVQSIGGGGGKTDVKIAAQEAPMGAADFRLGSENGSGEVAGAVSINRTGDAMIDGSRGRGLIAQSIGGGGGLLSYTLTEPASEEAREAVRLSLGGRASTGANGGNIAMTRNGTLSLAGERTNGIVLQSIGGGGGHALINADTRALNVEIGGSEGTTGDAGDITFGTQGAIVASGAHSHAVTVQSIGGGGGLVRHGATEDQTAVTFGTANAGAGGGANTGTGGDITLDLQGTIETTGENSIGVFAQSLGGGGGYVDQIGAVHAGGSGDGGDVSLVVDGLVAARAAQSTGIHLHSQGGTTGALDVEIAANGIVAAMQDSTALRLQNGAGNRIANAGLLIADEENGGMAVVAQGGDVTIANFGHFSGSIAATQGALTNASGGLVETGSEIDLGAIAGAFENFGRVSIGHNGFIGGGALTRLNGSYSSNDAAFLAVDLSFVDSSTAAAEMDRIDASGAAQLGGMLGLTVHNRREIAPGRHSFTFFQTETSDIASSLTLEAPNSVVAQFSLDYPTTQQANVVLDVDFAPDGLLGRQRQFGEYINRVQIAGGTSEAIGNFVTDLSLITEFGVLAETYDAFNGEVYAQNLANTVATSARLDRAIATCARGGVVTIRDTACTWGQAVYSRETRGAHGTFEHAEMTNAGLQGGGQRQIDSGDFLSFGGAYIRSAGAYGNNAQSNGTSFQIGSALKRRLGNSKLIYSLGLGQASYDVMRQGTVDGTPTTFEGAQNITYLSFGTRFQHVFERGNSSIIPEIGISARAYHARGFDETASGASALGAQSQSGVDVAIDAGISFGHTVQNVSSGSLSTALNIGVEYYLSDLGFETGLAGVSSAVAPNTSHASRDRLRSTIGASLLWQFADGGSVDVFANGTFSQNSKGVDVGMRVSFDF